MQNVAGSNIAGQRQDDQAPIINQREMRPNLVLPLDQIANAAIDSLTSFQEFQPATLEQILPAAASQQPGHSSGHMQAVPETGIELLTSSQASARHARSFTESIARIPGHIGNIVIAGAGTTDAVVAQP